ncbi:MAG TPA: hypothetical protein PKN33_21265 [Phycisphaerae bacterium]|nr:hypothetical protein [Phycisphaerae bacterium]
MPGKIIQPVPDSDYLLSVPTELRNLIPVFRGTMTSAARQVEKLRRWLVLKPLPVRRGCPDGGDNQRRVAVEVRRMKFHNGGIAPAPGKPVAYMGMGNPIAAEGDEHIIEQCLNTLAGLNSDCFLTLFALIQMASENDGLIAADITDLGRRRGWPPGKLDNRSRSETRTRRERLREHVELLSQVEFLITDLADERGAYVAFPLLVYMLRQGEQGPPQQNQLLYQFHPLLWIDMTVRQRTVLIDEELLKANPRRDEWLLRLAWYMGSRWAPSWVSKSLDQRGGRLTERLGVMLAGSCIECADQLRHQGRKWLRRRFRTAMDGLVHWSPRSLIGGYDIVENPKSPLEDRVTFWPTETVANLLTATRSQAIASREARNDRSRSRGRTNQSKDEQSIRKEATCPTTKC